MSIFLYIHLLNYQIQLWKSFTLYSNGNFISNFNLYDKIIYNPNLLTSKFKIYMCKYYWLKCMNSACLTLGRPCRSLDLAKHNLSFIHTAHMRPTWGTSPRWRDPCTGYQMQGSEPHAWSAWQRSPHMSRLVGDLVCLSSKMHEAQSSTRQR